MGRVLVVDDDPHLTAALEGALDREGYEVTSARDGLSGIELAATWQPDLVVLDLSMPGLGGLEVLERLRPWCSAPVLVLSASEQSRLKAEALDRGADDYLQKPFDLDELNARLRALRRRGAPAADTPPVLTFGPLAVDLAAQRLAVDGDEVRLTPTEWRILRELATHPGRLLTHQWLMWQVWDDRHGDETRDSLRTHLRSLRAKLGDDAKEPRYIRTESGTGYRWVAVDPGQAEPVPAPPVVPAESSTDPDDPWHELTNAVTALRVAAQLSRRGLDVPDADVRASVEHVEALSARVARLLAAVAPERG